ncbi:MAG: DUF2273 domain-containing protein [Firmicutes bacterium]|jgi:uncharacterized membrane protein|nr:DUF2273 domain-containing protein [Bacillota bacterium]
MEELWDQIRRAIHRHKGRFWGSVIGLVVALLILRFGFWRALFICFCLLVGYFVGSLVEREELPELLRRLWPR